MYLSDVDIRKSFEEKDIVISDFTESRLQPASYDILLWNKFLIVKWSSTPYVDPVNKILPEYEEVFVKDGEAFILHPNETVLGTSKDYFGSDKYLVHLWGKSSLARIWIVVHNTAWLINPGHFLNITFELGNFSRVPVILRPWMEIAQIFFSTLTSSCEKNYKDTWRYKSGKDNFVAYEEKK
jgi:dCTP deaminase